MFSLQYIAGFFDGEGSISLNRRKPGWTMVPQLTLTQCNREILVSIQRDVGGAGYIVKKPRYSEKHTQGWSYQLGGQGVVDFLKLLLPYLYIKLSQAKLVIEFWETRECGLARPGIPSGISEEEKQKRETYQTTLKTLNGRYLQSNLN